MSAMLQLLASGAAVAQQAATSTKLGGRRRKFQAQVQYFVEQPDAFGPEWLLKLTFAPNE